MVESIVFHNDGTGFTVAKVIVDSRPRTIVGQISSIFEGQIIQAEGKIVQSERWGEQFSVESYSLSEPISEVGIVKYLSSGLIPGIGPVTARNIVGRFGKETFDVIELNPQLLTEVSGVSPKKAAAIGDAFLQLKDMQDVVMFLQKYDITDKMAQKIYKIYGDRTKSVMQTNPYRLIEDVDRVGFKTADKMALSLGIEKDSEYRLRAGLVYVLKTTSERDGNTFLPVELVTKELTKLLEIPIAERKTQFDNVVNQLALESVVKRCVFDGVDCLMLVRFFNAELKIANRLITLNNSVDKHELDLSDEITNFERFSKVKFHDNQKKAIEIAVNNGVCVITGGPGTGKTTIIKCILEIFKNRKLKASLLAPTGRAAKRMSESCGEEASTIHRALMVGKSDDINEEGYFYYNEMRKYPFDVVIVDEMSMVDVNLMLSLLNALANGTRLVLVGDINQLPSVGAGNVLSDIIRSEQIKCAQLTHVYRQSESSLIITNAHAINNGNMPTIDNKCKDFFFEARETPDEILTTITSLVTTRLPKYLNISPEKIQVLAPMRSGVCGIDNLNTILQEKINPPESMKLEYKLDKVVFRVGDKVMQTSNNYSQTWRKPRKNGSFEMGEAVFNGDIGFVTGINKLTDSVEVTFEDGRITEYSREDAKQMMLSYAITIHKSQGSEFDVVVIPIIAGASSILTRNLLYTAVTRAKQMVVLVGTRKNLRIMVNNNYTAKRYSALSLFLEKIGDGGNQIG